MKPVFKKNFLLSSIVFLLIMGCALSTPKSRLFGSVYFTDEGGFEIQKINHYNFMVIPGGFEMMSPDSQTMVGPGFYGYGGLVDQERTTEELWKFLTLEEYKFFQFEKPKDRKIDGYTGYIAEFNGIQENTKIKGKLFAVMFDQNQQFYLLGQAPEDEYREFEKLFDMTLKTVKFYVPNQVIMFDNPYKRNIDESEFYKSPIPYESTEVAP